MTVDAVEFLGDVGPGQDHGDLSPTWLAAPVAAQDQLQPFDLFYGGSACGRVLSPMSLVSTSRPLPTT